MDFADYGAEAEELFRQQALAGRARMPPVRASAKWCEGEACGVRIPEARRLAVPGVVLCVECQDRIEKTKKAGL